MIVSPVPDRSLPIDRRQSIEARQPIIVRPDRDSAMCLFLLSQTRARHTTEFPITKPNMPIYGTSGCYKHTYVKGTPETYHIIMYDITYLSTEHHRCVTYDTLSGVSGTLRQSSLCSRRWVVYRIRTLTQRTTA